MKGPVAAQLLPHRSGQRHNAIPMTLAVSDEQFVLGPTNVWQTGGNSGTTPGTHFLGTTDNQALELNVNGARALRLEPTGTNGSVIGVVTQSQRLGETGHGLEGMLVIDRIDEIPWRGSDGGGRWWRCGRHNRILGLGAPKRPGVLEGFDEWSMDWSFSCTAHSIGFLPCDRRFLRQLCNTGRGRGHDRRWRIVGLFRQS